MDNAKITQLRKHYEHTLFDDVIPFWMKHSPDREYGGYFTLLDHDGTPYSTDKFMWPQAREVWMFSTLCDLVEKRDEWVEMAKLGWDFIMKHAFHESGRAYFSFKRDGTPLTMPRQIFSETFIIIAGIRYHVLPATLRQPVSPVTSTKKLSNGRKLQLPEARKPFPELVP